MSVSSFFANDAANLAVSIRWIRYSCRRILTFSVNVKTASLTSTRRARTGGNRVSVSFPSTALWRTRPARAKGMRPDLQGGEGKSK